MLLVLTTRINVCCDVLQCWQIYADEREVQVSERLTEEAVRVCMEEAGVAEPVFDQASKPCVFTVKNESEKSMRCIKYLIHFHQRFPC